MGRVRTGKKRSEAWGERTLECEYREEWGSTPAPDTALSFVVLIARPEHIGGECKTAAAADEDEPAIIRKETRKQAARSFSFDRLGATRASSPRSSSFCMEEVELKNEQRSKGKEPNEQSNRDSNRKRGQAMALVLLLSLIVVFNLLVGARLLSLLFFSFFLVLRSRAPPVFLLLH